MTSQELEQRTKIPTKKAKGYILLKRAKDRGKRLFFVHKGIINNNSFTLESVTKSGYYNQSGDRSVF